MLALLVLLFHVEVIAGFSHFFHQDSLKYEGYRVTLPWRWIIQKEGQEKSGRPFVWAVAGRGVLRGWNDQQWQNSFTRSTSMANVEVHFVKPESASSEGEALTSSSPDKARNLSVRGGLVRCKEDVPEGARFIRARCIGKSDDSSWMIQLTFVGRPEMLPEFYSFAANDVQMATE